MSEPEELFNNFLSLIEWTQWLNAIDGVDQAKIGIDLPHHEIHDGNHYTCNVVDTSVDIAAPKYIRCTAPDTTTRIHWVTEVSADGAALVEFYENPTINAAGTAMAEQNNDRNSPNTAELVCREDATTQAPNNDGTLLFSRFIGGTGVGGTSTSGEIGTRQEWILLQAGEYIIKVTVAANGTQVSITNAWYEVTP